MTALLNGSGRESLNKSMPNVYTSTIRRWASSGSGKQVTALTCARPPGGKECGPNPTDRSKPGIKDHILVDGRGVPLSILVTAANVNDSPMLGELINHCAVVRPRPLSRQPQHLCLDAAYDNAPAHRVVMVECYEGHIAPRGGRDESLPRHASGQARRWVVERTHAWHDRFRRLVVNWEKTIGSRTAFLWLASALVAYRT